MTSFKITELNFAFPLINLLILLAAVTQLYRSYSSDTAYGLVKEAGFVSFKNNKLQHKISNQVLFIDLEKNGKVFNGDTIRTSRNASAVIKLKHGLEIRLDEMSMIVLNLKEKKFDIDFKYGSLKSRFKPTTDNAILNIKSGDKKIHITEGDVNLAKNKNEDFILHVEKGEAILEDKNGKKLIKKNQVALVTTEGITVHTIPFELIAPQNGTPIFTNEDENMVDFHWINNKKSDIVFTLAADRFFRKVLKKTSTAEEEISFLLKPGRYYWRLSNAKSKTVRDKQSAVTAGFSIIKLRPLKMYSPMNNELFRYYKQSPHINFAWSKNRNAENYLLEIASDRGFRKVLKNINTLSNNVSHSFASGRYYWRVKMNLPDSKKIISSHIFTFSVRKQNKLTPPRLIRPQNNKNIAAVYLKKGMLFSWTDNGESPKFLLVIDRNRNFRSPLIKRSIKRNFTSVRATFKQGRYYWRVRAYDSLNRTSDFSDIKSFNVSKMKALELFAPANGSELSGEVSKNNGIKFSWIKQPIFGNYHFEISKSKQFKKLMRREESHNSGRLIWGLTPGRYYWRVSFYNDINQLLSRSAVRVLSIIKGPEPPEIIFPGKNRVVDMNNRNVLSFKWKSVKGAAFYNLALFHYRGRGRRHIFTIKAKNNRYIFRKIENLDTGRFVWSLQTVRRRKGKYEAGETNFNQFHITLSDQPETPEFESPEAR